MRARHILTIGAAVLVAATALPSEAGAPVLDGKKVKKITKVVKPQTQDNDADNVTAITAASAPNRANCAPPRCTRVDFVYQPAKGVKGNVLLKVTWTNPASDFDLYFADERKNDKAHCGGFGGLGEALVIRGSSLKVGRKYTLVVDHFRAVEDTITATVEFPTKRAAATTVPADVDGLMATNCVLDGNQ